MDELTRKRLDHNEQVFRQVNEEIDARTDGSPETEYVCECADPTCAATIRLTAAEYEDVRRAPNRFVVVPGHHRSEIERVVDGAARYYVVEKL